MVSPAIAGALMAQGITNAGPPGPLVPVPTSCTPNAGSIAGGTAVSVAGTHLDSGITPVVLFGGIAATGVVGVSALLITCTTPAFPGAQLVNVTVTTENGTGYIKNGFTYT